MGRREHNKWSRPRGAICLNPALLAATFPIGRIGPELVEAIGFFPGVLLVQFNPENVYLATPKWHPKTQRCTTDVCDVYTIIVVQINVICTYQQVVSTLCPLDKGRNSHLVLGNLIGLESHHGDLWTWKEVISTMG
ncbi:hypothetical protein XELAEV_18026128mg [Xenopus laevis]|uniref:Uncharacterized protein n=1 Tax=Xenopus laevis TaxID=8355 RepID=A0A974CV33_XENLA|nr:hypothetical protein XELAEV_18026128mg [Xenopus laevis]